MTTDFFGDDVLATARQALRDDRIEPDAEHPTAIWWVHSLHNANTYRVQCDYNPERGTVTWITCTCKHGLNAGGGWSRCYHSAATLMFIRRQRAGE